MPARGAGGRFISSGGGSSGASPITITLNQKQMDAAVKRLDRYAAKPLKKRAEKAYLEGAKRLVRPLRAAAPVGPTGNLRRSISARSNRLRPGEMAAATAGTRQRIAPHRHLVIEGTKPHSLAAKRPGKHRVSYIPEGRAVFGPRMGRFVTNTHMRHPGSKANPFVTRTVESLAPQVRDFINAQVADIRWSGIASL